MNDPAQATKALARANEIRLARADIRRRLFARETTAAAVVLTSPPEVASMTVGDLLRAQRQWGRDRTGRFLRSLPMSDARRVGDLTERERWLIAGRLNGFPMSHETAA